jgi:hypothetical protein
LAESGNTFHKEGEAWIGGRERVFDNARFGKTARSPAIRGAVREWVEQLHSRVLNGKL